MTAGRLRRWFTARVPWLRAPELSLAVVLIAVGVLVVGFLVLGSEVAEGETAAFDRAILLALRDTLAAAEWVAWLALRRQEAAPRSAWTAAQQRNRLRARYCTSAPPEPYCEMPSAQPIMPPASSRPRRHIAG